MKKLVSVISILFALVGCSPKYTVAFDLDGGVYVGGGNLIQEISEGDNAIEPILTKEGYVFDGWSNSLNNIVQNVNVIAKWRNYTQEEIYTMTVNSVVEIISYENNRSSALGSGFFYNNNGEIITNFHVIEGASRLKVILNNGSEYNVISIIGYDKDLDLAILKIDYKNEEYLELSTREYKTGENIYAIGSSKGFTNTFSTGNISQVERKIDNVSLIQMTAPISSGNSGGPLIDIFGKVIGVNALKFNDGDNIYFSISISELSKVDKTTPLTIEQFLIATDPILRLKNHFIKNGTRYSSSSLVYYSITHYDDGVKYTFNYVPEDEEYYLNNSSSAFDFWIVLNLEDFPFFYTEINDASGDLIGYDDDALFLRSSLSVIVVFDVYNSFSSLKSDYDNLLQLTAALMILVFDDFIESNVGQYLLVEE